MGAGKSTIGPLLAEELRWPFLDTDREIELRTGVDIPWIFDVEGEAGFRARESAVLQEVALQGPAVVATGGGIVLDPVNRQCLQSLGVVVYLQATLEQLVLRTAKDRKRPLLQGGDAHQILERLLIQRAPLYQEVADIIFMTDDRNPRVAARDLASQVVERLSLSSS